MKVVKVLGTGDEFGELALLNSESKAFATVITTMESEFACLDKINYVNILGKLKEQELLRKVEFL